MVPQNETAVPVSSVDKTMSFPLTFRGEKPLVAAKSSPNVKISISADSLSSSGTQTASTASSTAFCFIEPPEKLPICQNTS